MKLDPKSGIRRKFLDSLKDCEELTEKILKLNTEILSPELKAFALGYSGVAMTTSKA